MFAVLFVVVIVVLVIATSSPSFEKYDITSPADDGYLAIARLFEQYGVAVEARNSENLAGIGPNDVVFFAIDDTPSQRVSDQLVEIAEAGARVVVKTGFTPTNDQHQFVPSWGYINTDGMECPELGIESVNFNSFGESTAVSGRVGCFGSEDALVVISAAGTGEMIAIPSLDDFTNRYLYNSPTDFSAPSTTLVDGDVDIVANDNAYVAYRILAPEGTETLFVVNNSTSKSDSSTKDSITDFISDPVKLFGLQLLACCGWFGLYRANKSTVVLAEPNPVPIESSSYVDAVGNIWMRQNDAARGRDVLQSDALRRVYRQLSIPPGEPIVRHADAIARASSFQSYDIMAMFSPDNANSAEDLIVLAENLQRLVEETSQ